MASCRSPSLRATITGRQAFITFFSEPPDDVPDLFLAPYRDRPAERLGDFFCVRTITFRTLYVFFVTPLHVLLSIHVRPLHAHHKKELECSMAIDADTLKALVERELQQLSDSVRSQIRGLLVEPKAVLRNWDYGKPGEQFPCWLVLAHQNSNTAIAYCESGFGPQSQRPLHAHHRQALSSTLHNPRSKTDSF